MRCGQRGIRTKPSAEAASQSREITQPRSAMTPPVQRPRHPPFGTQTLASEARIKGIPRRLFVPSMARPLPNESSRKANCTPRQPPTIGPIRPTAVRPPKNPAIPQKTTPRRTGSACSVAYLPSPRPLPILLIPRSSIAATLNRRNDRCRRLQGRSVLAPSPSGNADCFRVVPAERAFPRA